MALGRWGADARKVIAGLAAVTGKRAAYLAGPGALPGLPINTTLSCALLDVAGDILYAYVCFGAGPAVFLWADALHARYSNPIASCSSRLLWIPSFSYMCREWLLTVLSEIIRASAM